MSYITSIQYGPPRVSVCALMCEGIRAACATPSHYSHAPVTGTCVQSEHEVRSGLIPPPRIKGVHQSKLHVIMRLIL